MSSVGKASGSGSWDSIKNFILCQWGGTISSACKFLMLIFYCQGMERYIILLLHLVYVVCD